MKFNDVLLLLLRVGGDANRQRRYSNVARTVAFVGAESHIRTGALDDVMKDDNDG